MTWGSPYSCKVTIVNDRDRHLLALRLNHALASVLAATALACVSLAQAQPASAPAVRVPALATSGGPAWSSLSAAHRAALLPLERDWSSIDSQRKAKWLEIATRFPRMPVNEQERVQDRMAEWARMTPTERGRARVTFQEAKQLSPQERQARWEAYQALPEDDRKALAAKATQSAAKPVPAGASANALSTLPKQSSSSQTTKAPLLQAVAPTVVQGKPGATTMSIAKVATPPAHQQPGQPKIAAKPAQVDRATMLPRLANVTGPAIAPALASAPKPGP